MFQPIDYLEWVLNRLDAAAHDLGSSDLRPDAVDHGEHVVPPVLADLPAPDPDATAAAFLEKFIQDDMPWIHIDIAGVTLVKEASDLAPSGATGWGVLALDRMIRDGYEG